MVDSPGKDCSNNYIKPYKYKNTLPVPVLGMVDNVFVISESGKPQE